MIESLTLLRWDQYCLIGKLSNESISIRLNCRISIINSELRLHSKYKSLTFLIIAWLTVFPWSFSSETPSCCPDSAGTAEDRRARSWWPAISRPREGGRRWAWTCSNNSQSDPLSLVQISPDSVLSLVVTYYAGTKVYVITRHLEAGKISPARVILCLFLCCYGMLKVASMHRYDLLTIIILP